MVKEKVSNWEIYDKCMFLMGKKGLFLKDCKTYDEVCNYRIVYFNALLSVIFEEVEKQMKTVDEILTDKSEEVYLTGYNVALNDLLNKLEVKNG